MKNLLKYSFLIITISFYVFSACSPESNNISNNPPAFESAIVYDNSPNKIIALFNQTIFSDGSGFTITVDDVVNNITAVEGSGSSQISLALENDISYGQNVTIEYDATTGNAVNKSSIRLSSFSTKSVTNNITESDLTILIPNIPPEAENDTLWLVIRTSESASTWLWSFRQANINIKLSASPEQTPFDIIVFATDNGSWRPDSAFETGYYATLLNQIDKYQKLKIVSWLKSDYVSNIDMGYMNNESTDIENTTLENAFELRTDGMDYVQGEIDTENIVLWYKFSALSNLSYQVSVKDNYSDSDDFSGIVHAIVCDSYGIPVAGITDAIGNHPTTVSGANSMLYLKVEKSDLAGRDGTFQIIVMKNS